MQYKKGHLGIMRTVLLAAAISLACFFLAGRDLSASENYTRTGYSKDDKSFLSYRFGLKGNITTGYASKNFYCAPFASMTLRSSFGSLNAAYAWYANYQIYDTYGTAHTLDMHEPRATLRLTLAEIVPFINYIEFMGGYRLGASSRFGYLSNGLTGGINIEIKKFFAGFIFDWTLTRYNYIKNPAIIIYPSTFLAEINEYLPYLQYLYFKKNGVQFRYLAYSVIAGYSFTERFSLDAGYEHLVDINNIYTDFARYDRDSFRLGSIIGMNSRLSASIGINAGYDSMKYIITGFDSGFILKLFKSMKIECIYRLDYHKTLSQERHYGFEMWLMNQITDPGLYRLMQWIYTDSYYSQKTRQKRAALGTSFLSHEISFSISSSL